MPAATARTTWAAATTLVPSVVSMSSGRASNSASKPRPEAGDVDQDIDLEPAEGVVERLGIAQVDHQRRAAGLRRQRIEPRLAPRGGGDGEPPRRKRGYDSGADAAGGTGYQRGLVIIERHPAPPPSG